MSLNVGDKVFAKIRFFPPWPATVLNVFEEGRYKYKVCYYGTGELGELKKNQVIPFFQNKSIFENKIKNKKWRLAMKELLSELPDAGLNQSNLKDISPTQCKVKKKCGRRIKAGKGRKSKTVNADEKKSIEPAVIYVSAEGTSRSNERKCNTNKTFNDPDVQIVNKIVASNPIGPNKRKLNLNVTYSNEESRKDLRVQEIDLRDNEVDPLAMDVAPVPGPSWAHPDKHKTKLSHSGRDIKTKQIHGLGDISTGKRRENGINKDLADAFIAILKNKQCGNLRNLIYHLAYIETLNIRIKHLSALPHLVYGIKRLRKFTGKSVNREQDGFERNCIIITSAADRIYRKIKNLYRGSYAEDTGFWKFFKKKTIKVFLMEKYLKSVLNYSR